MSLTTIPVQLLTLAKNDGSLKVLVIGGFCFLAICRWTFNGAKREIRSLRRQLKYKKDVVILHRSRKGFNMPHDRPSLMQLESFLRFAKIHYESEFDADGLKNGACITYNLQDVVGAKYCIKFLMETLKLDIDDHLGENDKAVAYCFRTLAEESLKWVTGISIFLLEPDNKRIGLKKRDFNESARAAKSIAYDHGYGRHTKDEIYSIGIADVKAMNDFIGDKKYLMGDRICSADASIFAHITQVINHDKGKLHDYLMNECKNLVRYHETIKTEYWSDWDELLRNKEKVIK